MIWYLRCWDTLSSLLFSFIFQNIAALGHHVSDWMRTLPISVFGVFGKSFYLMKYHITKISTKHGKLIWFLLALISVLLSFYFRFLKRIIHLRVLCFFIFLKLYEKEERNGLQGVHKTMLFCEISWVRIFFLNKINQLSTWIFWGGWDNSCIW